MTYGGVEAGGTKFVCVVGTGPDDVRALTRFPTTSPEETLEQTLSFFRQQPEALDAVGVGAFGPVDLNLCSSTYGHITNTPKEGWTNTNVYGVLGTGLDVPIAIDTDVNAAALGEHRWGAAQEVETCVYLTVGTGIGGGALVKGRPLHGLMHPEMGHIYVQHHPEDTFTGTCPFHGSCLEGLASGVALEARWGCPAASLPEDHPAWELEAYYLALALVNYICTLSPERIVLGGGVMHREGLFPMIRRNVQQLLNGYIGGPQVAGAIDTFIVPPALGDRAGALGALTLARKVHHCELWAAVLKP